MPVATAVLSAIEPVRPPVRGRRQTIDLDMSPDVELEADPARLTQIVASLLSNAVKYTPAGGHMAVRVRVAAEMVEIEVADRGWASTRNC